MSMRSFIKAMVVVGGVVAAVAVHAAATGRVVKLTCGDQMKFDVTVIKAKPGEALRVRLTSTGTLPKAVMAHNFVLLAKGTDASAFVTAAATAGATGYIPTSMKSKVLAATTLAGPGETVEVAFKAPTTPGTYTYVCSFSGHYVAGMKGMLTVQ
jgi:azurin